MPLGSRHILRGQAAKTGRLGLVLFLSVLASAGCGRDPAHPPRPAPIEPLGPRLQALEPRLQELPFRTLLNFEAATDGVFVRSRSAAIRSADFAHTGQWSLRLPAGAAEASVKLSSLLSGQPFPGPWTLAGVYVRATARTPVRVMLISPAGVVLERGIEVPPGRWTPLLLDITALGDPARDDLLLRLDFPGGAAGDILLDDVLVIDNTRVWVDRGEKSTWRVRQRGFSILIESDRFNLAARTPEAQADGWVIEEAGRMRLRLASATGRVWTLYPDGRQYLGGAFSAMGMDAKSAGELAAVHADPPEVQVSEETGRLIRTADGDRENDGYVETLGAYLVRANGPRAEVRIVPREAGAARTVIQFQGLGEGEPLATLDGRLVETWDRLDNGDLLVEVPGRLEAAATLSVRMRR